jgi:cytochrome b
MSESTPTSQASAEETPARRMVWDLPTRLFHWTLALLFVGAFGVALLSSEHSRAFLIHMLLGLTLVFAILLRVVWGLVGSRPSRFGSFLYSPKALVRYVREALAGRDRPSPGHNPGTSYAIYGMLLVPLGLAATGLLKTSGREWAEEVHAVLAYGMVALVGLHLLGLMWHARRHGDGIAMAMVDGRRPVSEAEAIPSSRAWAGALFLVLMGGWGVALTRGFDSTARQVTLPGVGTVLPLGEAREAKEASEDSEHHGKKRGDDE